MKLYGNSNKQEKKEKKGHARRNLIIALGSVGILALAAVIAWNVLFVAPPVENAPELPTEYETDAEGNTVVDDKGQPVTKSKSQHVAGRRDDVRTFAVAALDPNSNNTDTIMVVTLDSKNKTADVMNVPRDLQVPFDRQVPKINGAYQIGYNKNKNATEGIARLKQDLRTCLGFTPDYTMIINIDLFIELVDIIGGVEFDVPQKMRYTDSSQGLYISLNKGLQVLDGQKAMQLVRFRSYLEGDPHRIQVQQDFLKAVLKQTLSVKNFDKMGEILDACHKNLITDLSDNNIMWLASEILSFKEENIRFHVLPNIPVWWNNGRYPSTLSYEIVDEKPAIELLNQYMSPLLAPITSDDLQLSKHYDRLS